MEEFGQRPVWSMSGSEMLTTLDGVQAQLDRLQTYRLELLAGLDANGHAAEIGARGTVQLISTRHRLDHTDVRRDLRLALALPKYEQVRAALNLPDDSVRLHPGQADAIVTALERIPATAQVPVEDLQVAERELVKSGQVLCPADLRSLGKRVRDTLDTDGTEPDERQALAAENLWLKRGELGIEFGGYLAGAHAELLQTLVFAGAKPRKTLDGRRDPRSRGRRQADALTGVLESAAATGTAVPAHGAIKPHVTVTIGLDALTTGTGTGSLASGATLSAATVRRIACDAGVIPLVLGSDSEPLDVGTEHRFVTPAIRRALNVRDQGCIICGAPPAMSEAHHVVHWADGGETRITNLALLCKRHHIDVHQGHWTLSTETGRPTIVRPPWTSPTHSTVHSPARPSATPFTRPPHSTAYSAAGHSATPRSRPPPDRAELMPS
ncbi:HNH endonuclease [Kribbella italica]|uniref:HNH nuclease domain-containing protein n=1 Tax=Kribbella italica TaxID=1540520 RepID=A0A7W9MRL5_9ACTN|nr:HNH endonuclease signature motif containing protein [Kribbella italica]MBB5833761.1 hypothetical protein [Kribbella italica]